jgi:hypothetical protein
MTRFEQPDHRLQDADVRLAAGDDERVAAGGQAAQEAFLGRRGEVELGERRVAQRRDLGDERAEAVGFSSVPMTWMPSSRAAVASWTQRRTTASPVVDRRHQAHLGVDDQERALVGLAEKGHRQAPRDRPFSAMRAASAQSVQALRGRRHVDELGRLP